MMTTGWWIWRPGVVSLLSWPPRRPRTQPCSHNFASSDHQDDDYDYPDGDACDDDTPSWHNPAVTALLHNTMMMIMKYHEYNAAADDNNDYTSRDQMLLKTESLY